MAERSFAEEFGSELGKQVTGQAILWGPAFLFSLLLGPAGLLLALPASVIIADNLPSKGEAPKD
jgi:hypothetical protein